MLDERIDEARRKGERSGSQSLTTASPVKRTANQRNPANKGMIIKSPSDTTIYAPALNLANSATQNRQQTVVTANGVGFDKTKPGNYNESPITEKQGDEVGRVVKRRSQDNDLVMKISNFVDQL